MTLMEAFSEYLVKGHQGQLVLKFVGDVHLCKLLVEDGQAVFISHGRLTPEQVVDSLSCKTVEWVNFIAGYPVRRKVDFPLHEKLLAAAEGNSTAPTPTASGLPPAASANQTPAEAAPSGPSVAPEKIAEAIEGFIELIGPLGTILAEQAAAAINYTSGTPMPGSSYNIFILALANEVPDGARNSFLARYQP